MLQKKLFILLFIIVLENFSISCSRSSSSTHTQDNGIVSDIITPTSVDTPTPTPAFTPISIATPAPYPTVTQPTNLTISSTSPNGLYTIEMYGTNTNITAGGFYPYAGTRLLTNVDNTVIWSEDFGYYSADFIWSEDSRFVAVNVEARTYSDSYIIDTQSTSVIDLPRYNELSTHYISLAQINSLYMDYAVSKWNDNKTVTIEFQGDDDEDISGIFTYDLDKKEINFIE